MANPKLNLLLVEDNADDERSIREALIEIEEGGPQYGWLSSHVIAVDYLSDALHCLERARFDAVLLDLHLPDSPMVLNTLSHIQIAAPGTPVLALMDDADECLAHRLLREGAQDVLVKAEIECAPLARALRFAIERQRRCQALRAISFFDDLTGFYSRYGFTSLLHHDLLASKATGAPLTMGVLELSGLPEDTDSRDLAFIDASERLQSAFPDAALIGRLDATTFGIITFHSSEGRFRSSLAKFGRELQRVKNSLRVLGATVSVPEGGPFDLEELITEARPRFQDKAAMLAG